MHTHAHTRFIYWQHNNCAIESVHNEAHQMRYMAKWNEKGSEWAGESAPGNSAVSSDAFHCERNAATVCVTDV